MAIRAKVLMPSSCFKSVASLAVLGAMLCQVPSYAQSSGLGGSTGSSGSTSNASGAEGALPSRSERRGNGQKDGGKAVRIQPYLELNQIVSAELSPGNDVLTYSQAVVGVDAAISGRNTGLSGSVRYEYHQGWSKGAGHGDSISGIVSGYTGITPGLTLNVAGLATRTNNTGTGRGGGLGGSGLASRGNSTVYSVQAGPSYVGRAGDLDISANYRVGYNKITTRDDGRDQNGNRISIPNLFDESVTQIADVQAGFAPGVILPIGLGVGGSAYQEDLSFLDERVRDLQGRAIVTIPVSPTVQVSGAVGYENLEVSSRDVQVGPDGAPLVRNGRYVTDKSKPRQIAYDTEGLIWDVGVSWRPSRRTSLTANVGKRYGTMNYRGSFSWAPSARQTWSVSVYNTVSAFGGNMGRVLSDLPDDFEALRNPISGDLSGCVSSLQGNNCVTGAFTSLRSSAFRSRGVAANYNISFGKISAGVGIGYDNRKYIAGRSAVLASTDGMVDENYWMSANVNWRIDDRSGLFTNAYANVSTSDGPFADITTVGLTTSYYRNLSKRWRAHAALGIDGTLGSDDYVDYWTASALVGMRYNF